MGRGCRMFERGGEIRGKMTFGIMGFRFFVLQAMDGAKWVHLDMLDERRFPT